MLRAPQRHQSIDTWPQSEGELSQMRQLIKNGNESVHHPCDLVELFLANGYFFLFEYVFIAWLLKAQIEEHFSQPVVSDEYG